MKNSKKILIVAMSMIMIIATLVPSYAVNSVIDDYKIPPSDLGEEIPLNTYNTGYGKYYIRIDLSTTTNANVQFRLFYDEYSTTWRNTIYITVRDNHISITNSLNYYSDYFYVVVPIISIDFTDELYLYVPVYAFNAMPFTGFDTSVVPEGLTYYYSTTNEESVIQREAFQVGYENGYYNGYTDGIADTAGYQSDLNLVEHCEQLLGTFVGDDYAHYITPLCLALVVILVYFLFIRWLLALVKSKNVTRVADIIVCTACIIMLVIMYAPMLDLTIKQAQTVYQITADTVVGG